MNFGQALEMLEDFKHVRRAGWNGPGQHVYMAAGIVHNQIPLNPVFVLCNAQGYHQPGWVPSMGDMLAKDWENAAE